jgi:hypothetical protein
MPGLTPAPIAFPLPMESEAGLYDFDLTSILIAKPVSTFAEYALTS